MSLILGVLLAAVSMGLLAGGGAVTWLDNAQRDTGGFLTSGTLTLATPSYALSADQVDLGTSGLSIPSSLLGTIRIQATSIDPTRPVFIGIAPQDAGAAYLSGVARAVVTGWAGGAVTYQVLAGGAPAQAPTTAPIWIAKAAGTGTQTLTWQPTGGQWTIVVMNADGSPGVAVSGNVGATIPDIAWIATGLFAAGGVLLALGILLIVVPIVRASRPRTPAGP